MCDTSKMPAARRTARCSARTPSACGPGFPQPQKGTSLAPARTWDSNSGVRFRVGVVTRRRLAKRPGRSGPGQPGSAQEGRDLELVVGDLQRGALAIVVARAAVALAGGGAGLLARLARARTA